MDEKLKTLDERGNYSKVGDGIPLVSEDETDDIVEEEPERKYTKTEWLMLFSAAMLYFMGGVITSMIASFFPQVAKNKGISSSLNGVIFGVFPLVFAMLSPLLGKLIPILGIKTVLFTGLFVEGSCMIIYGIVASYYSGDTFIVLSFLYRIVAAIGVASSENSSLLLVCLVFRDRISSTFGMLEVCGSIGLMIGPVIGGGLYKLGGFVTPFIFAGGIVIIVLLLLVFFMPSLNNLEKEKTADDDSVSTLQVVFLPGVFLMCTLVVVFGTAIGFIEPTIALHLKNITEPHPVSSAEVGSIFVLLTGGYGLISPLVGYLCDKKVPGKYLIVFGLIVSAVSFLLLGPSPLLGSIKGKVWLVCLSLILFGIGFAFGLVPNIREMRESMLETGIAETEKSMSIITSIFNCVLNIGYVIGPVAGGYMVQYLKFPWAATILSFVLFGEALIVIIYLIIKHSRQNIKK